MKNIAILASGNGTNLQAITDNIAKGVLKVRCVLALSDRKDAYALKRAKKAGVETLYLDPKAFASKEAYERQVLAHLKKRKVDFVVLAGFMRILSPVFVRAYKNRILNIHPALLPAFKGGVAIKDAFGYGVKVTGVTVHFVDEKVDHGPIIAQVPVEVLDFDSCEDLEARVHQAEHKVYIEAIRRVTGGRYVVRGRKVLFK